jgi:predicted Fe-Mo cluster-binding NifX family protein
MKIAIGTDDKKSIRKGHFAQSLHFLIIELLNGEIVSRQYRQNPYGAKEQGKYHHGQVEKIFYLLGDCSLFMAKRMGKRSLAKLTARGIDCIITEIDPIDQAVEQYLYGRGEAFQYYDRRKETLIPCSQRMTQAVSPSSKNLQKFARETSS